MRKSLVFTALLGAFVFFASAPAHAQYGSVWNTETTVEPHSRTPVYQPWELSGSCRDQWGGNLNWGECYGSGGRVLGPHVTLVILADGRWEATRHNNFRGGGYQSYPQGGPQGYPPQGQFRGQPQGQRGSRADALGAQALELVGQALFASIAEDLIYDTPENRRRYAGRPPQYPQGYGGQPHQRMCYNQTGTFPC